MIFIFFAVIYLYWFVSFFLFFVVFAIWIKETFTCKNSGRQAIIRLRAGYRGSVWREIGYVLLIAYNLQQRQRYRAVSLN